MTHQTTERSNTEDSSKRKSTIMIIGLVAVMIILLVLSYVVSGYVSESEPEHGGAMEPNLEGTHWQLVSLNEKELIAGTSISGQFQEGQFAGKAGCNNYFTAFETEGGKLSFGTAGSTMMFCAEPEGVMDQESEYLSTLDSVASYRLEADKLEMMDAGGEVLLIFEVAIEE